jgi:hypothetical protein
VSKSYEALCTKRHLHNSGIKYELCPSYEVLLLVTLSIKLQNTPEKRRYSNFDLLVALIKIDALSYDSSNIPPLVLES